MNKSNFISTILHPEQIDLAGVNQLKELIRQFPYCTTAQILLAKGLHNSQDIAFEKQLRISAAYAMDRSVLHYLILERPATIVTKEPDIPTIETKYNAVEKPTEVIAVSEIKEVIGTEEKNETIVDQANLVEKEATEESPLLEKEKETNTQVYEVDPFLEREILSAAIHNTYLLEADEINESEEEPETKEIIKEIAEPINKNSAHSFSDWLKLMDGQTISEEKEDKEKAAPKAGSKDLVNKFITTAPQIKPKKEFYSASNMARLSVKENDDLVTETLANIYAQQGNTEKAISAYEKLALKYPEKRIYFANLIHKLGEEPNK